MAHRVVKLSHPPAVYGYEGMGARAQSPGNLGVWGDYKFEINNGVDECDSWVVFESTGGNESAVVPAGRTILILNEPEYVRSYSPEYLRQFDWIVSWRTDLPASNVIRSHCMDGWWLKRTYDMLKSDRVEKTGLMSVVASDKSSIPEHRKRFAFINRMIGHFKDRLTVFGSINGNYCSDKFAALAPYKYAIAIEAAPFPDYWTEKIADCYLSESMPLYYGAPNIGDYFDHDSFIAIDLDDYKASIRAIEGAIETDAYERNREKVLQAKQKVLDELQTFPQLARVLDRLPQSSERKRRELRPAVKTFLKPEGGWERELLL
jgi:hypothetical protein